MDAIGGYFGLELRNGVHYHKNALRLNTARNCFEYILLSRKYKKVYIPYYTCNVMLQPLLKYNISYEFYHLDFNLEPEKIFSLKTNEGFLYTNYYGLKQSCVEYLAKIYGSQLIVDNAQAFFATRVNGVDTFYSARKFLGVPDGAYLLTDALMDTCFIKDKSFSRIMHLVRRIDESAEAAYQYFRINDECLDNLEIMYMSDLTDRLLCNVDYEYIKNKRIKNWEFLDRELGSINLIHFNLSEDAVPMVYPFYSLDSSLRDKLIKSKIYVARYWPNVLDWCFNGSIEYNMCQSLIPLPVDQRYGDSEMKYIVDIIKGV